MFAHIYQTIFLVHSVSWFTKEKLKITDQCKRNWYDWVPAPSSEVGQVEKWARYGWFQITLVRINGIFETKKDVVGFKIPLQGLRQG